MRLLEASQKFTNAFDEFRISSNQGALKLLSIAEITPFFLNICQIGLHVILTTSCHRILFVRSVCRNTMHNCCPRCPCWSIVDPQTICPYENWTNVVFRQTINKKIKQGALTYATGFVVNTTKFPKKKEAWNRDLDNGKHHPHMKPTATIYCIN